MAHHLASLIAEADAATGDMKTVAEARAADLVLRVWAQRRDLPEAADPLGSYRVAIEVLSRLHPEQNPWRVFSGRGGVEGLLADLFDSMAKAVVGGILLTRHEEPQVATPAEQAALIEEERMLLQQFAWWETAVKLEPFQVRDSLIRSFLDPGEPATEEGEAPAISLHVDDASALGTDTRPGTGAHTADGVINPDEDKLERTVDPVSISPRPSIQVTEALENLRAGVASLIEAWNARPVED